MNNFDQIKKFPSTRWMGSKSKLINPLNDIFQDIEFKTSADVFGGSNIVGYLLKAIGKKVYTNDFMILSYYLSVAVIENGNVKLDEEEVELLISTDNDYSFVQTKFKGIYFSDDDNRKIDRIRENINNLDCKFKRAIALSALARSCFKKRARGIFTYTGLRYDDGRKDLQTGIADHFRNAVSVINNSVFKSKFKCKSFNKNVFDLSLKNIDLVYLDPPYFSKASDNDYVRRYHFVEGLLKQWEGLKIQEHTKTKKIESYKSLFSSRGTIETAIDKLFDQFSKSKIVMSYSSNSLPNKDTLVQMLENHGKTVEVFSNDYKYSFGNQNKKIGNNRNNVKEFIFVAL